MITNVRLRKAFSPDLRLSQANAEPLKHQRTEASDKTVDGRGRGTSLRPTKKQLTVMSRLRLSMVPGEVSAHSQTVRRMKRFSRTRHFVRFTMVAEVGDEARGAVERVVEQDWCVILTTLVTSILRSCEPSGHSFGMPTSRYSEPYERKIGALGRAYKDGDTHVRGSAVVVDVRGEPGNDLEPVQAWRRKKEHRETQEISRPKRAGTGAALTMMCAHLPTGQDRPVPPEPRWRARLSWPGRLF